MFRRDTRIYECLFYVFFAKKKKRRRKTVSVRLVTSSPETILAATRNTRLSLSLSLHVQR
jgi:hypothetical protein